MHAVNSGFPADILGLQVAEHGPDARVVTVTGEVDTVTAPQLAAVLTAQLAIAQLVVVNLDGAVPGICRIAGAIRGQRTRYTTTPPPTVSVQFLARQPDTGEHRTAGALHVCQQRLGRPEQQILTARLLRAKIYDDHHLAGPVHYLVASA
jgi:hypothetical protein